MGRESDTRTNPRIRLIIPALNEAEGLGRVLDELPPNLFASVIVADNGSRDETPAVARSRGAQVVQEPRRGYGRACLAALDALPADTEIVVFMDADSSDLPGEAHRLVEPILQNQADLVIGSRTRGPAERGALRWQQRWGNRLAVTLIRWLYGFRYTDLGPFRAVRADALRRLEMQDPDFGWTVEMQVKALEGGLRVMEVPVSYRRRIGRSKISGTLLGTLRAGKKIIWTILRLRFQRAAEGHGFS